MKIPYNFMNERTCRVCGRSYLVQSPADWGWLFRGIPVCSYSCMRKAERKKLEYPRVHARTILAMLARERKNGKDELER